MCVNQVGAPQIFVLGEEYSRAAARVNNQCEADGADGMRPKCHKNFAEENKFLTLLEEKPPCMAAEAAAEKKASQETKDGCMLENLRRCATPCW